MNAGVCPAGMDLHVCETLLLYQCGGKANINWPVLMVGARASGGLLLRAHSTRMRCAAAPIVTQADAPPWHRTTAARTLRPTTRT